MERALVAVVFRRISARPDRLPPGVAHLSALLGLTLLAARGAVGPEDATTQFFRSHPNEIDVVARGDRVLFANRQVGLEFRQTSRGFELTRLYGTAAGQDFLTPPDDSQPRDLFEIRLALDPRRIARDETGTTRETRIGPLLDRMADIGKAFGVGSQAGGRVSWQHEPGSGESRLHLQWQGIDVQEEKGLLDAEVTIRLRAGDPLSYWRIALKNRSRKYGIERTRLPILPLAPIGAAEDNTFLYPKWRGGLVTDPFHAPAGLGENYHRTGAYYPYYVNMQFWALYNRATRQGVYLGTRDPAPHLSHFLVQNSSREIAWSVSHFPANLSFAAEDFTLGYDCVAGPFTGDWYDACQIYRTWALAQSWCRLGPTATRRDVPAWYRDAPLMFYTVIADAATGTHSLADNLQIAADDFRAWLAWAGVPLPVNWYGFAQPAPGLSLYDRPASSRRPYPASSNVRQWAGFAAQFTSYAGNYPALPALARFSAVCRELREAGGRVCPYVCLQLLDQGPLDNAPFAAAGRLAVARDTYGAALTYPGLGLWLPCVAHAWWQDRLVDTCVGLVEREHAAGFYLDVMHGTGMPCFWTPHGHSAAGGSTMPRGMATLSRRIRDAVKAKDPEAIITGEDPAENMIDVIDGGLYQYTLRPENQAPLFATVYQDYTRRYGRELTIGPGDSFYLECASLFVEGAQVGRLPLRPRGGLLQPGNPAQQEMLDFLAQIVGYYKQDPAKTFLISGRLLRPLHFSSPSPMPRLRHGAPQGEAAADTGAALDTGAKGSFPQLLSGVFKTGDGAIGVFVVNAGGRPLDFAASLELAELGLKPGTPLSVERIDARGHARSPTTTSHGPPELQGTLGAREITFFRLRPENLR